VCYSDDHSKSVGEIAAPSPTRAIAFLDHVITTADGGGVWSPINPSDLSFTRVSFPADGVGYGLRQRGDFYRSSDGGMTWLKIADLPVASPWRSWRIPSGATSPTRVRTKESELSTQRALDGARSHVLQGSSIGRNGRLNAGAGEIDYRYDAANRRVKAVSGSTTTYYIWEGGQVIAEYTNGSATGTGLKFYHPDLLSTRMTTGAIGSVIGTQDNLPFGEDGGVSGNLEKHRFTSYERDPDGTDYAINRQYSTGIGRFR